MFKVLGDFSSKHLIGIHVEGKIEKSDYESLQSMIQEKSEKYGSLNMYLEFHNIQGVTPKAALDDIMTYFKYLTDFRKIAVVGEERWGILLSSTSSEFYSAKIRFFTHEKHEEAKKWISKS